MVFTCLKKKKRALNLNKLKVVAILYIFVFHVQNENMSLAPKAVWEAVRHQSFTRHFLRKGGAVLASDLYPAPALRELIFRGENSPIVILLTNSYRAAAVGV